MAITWTVLHPQRLIIAVGTIPVTATNILCCIEEFGKAGIDAYRKLFDLTALSGKMIQVDMQLAAARMAARSADQQMGPIAFIVSSDALAEWAALFRAPGADRPVQVFRDSYVARIWLDVTAPADQIPESAHE
jgi:hypothetical protein